MYMYSFNLKQQQQQLIWLVQICLSTDPPFHVEFVEIGSKGINYRVDYIKPAGKGAQNK